MAYSKYDVYYMNCLGRRVGHMVENGNKRTKQKL